MSPRGGTRAPRTHSRPREDRHAPLPTALLRNHRLPALPRHLGAIFWFWNPIPTPIWRVENEFAADVLHAISWTGWGIVLVSTFLIDHFALFGLRQSILQFRGKEVPHAPFRVRSFYRVVRHPLMLGFFIAFWSTPYMSAGRLLFAGVVTAYVLVAIQLEERDLVAEHGENYRAYRKNVPMVLPRP